MDADLKRHQLHHQPNGASTNYVERCCDGLISHEKNEPRRRVAGTDHWFDYRRATGLVSNFAASKMLGVRKLGLKAD